MSPTDDGDSETVQACPACDSSSVATNNIGGIQSVNPTRTAISTVLGSRICR